MMKKLLLLVLVLSLVMAGFAFANGKQDSTQTGSGDQASKAAPAEKVIKNPDTFIMASYGTVDSLDPSKAYDNASGGCIQNFYEPLVDFKGSSTSEYVPVLSTKVPSVENGLITNGGKTYKFPIRKGVKFHSGNTMTVEDAVYSFQRNLVTDPDGGPMWMLYEPLFGTSGSRDGDGNVVITMDMLNKAIQADGDYLVINLKEPFAPFLSIMPFYGMSILDKKFIIANGGWKGTQADIARVNNPDAGKEILANIESGTGPYTLDRWEKGVEMDFARFDGYWGPKPAMAKAIYKVVEEWSTRKLMLLQGDIDEALVDPMYYEEMNKEPGLTVYKGLVSLGNRGINFNLAINGQDNPAIGSGKLDGDGVPPNFFSDKDVRLGFTYCVDSKVVINDIIKGHGIPDATPLPAGMAFVNPDLKNLPFDLKKAEEHFKKAWGGKLWANGFTLDMLFNSGNAVREQTLKMMAENIMSLNPKFKVNVRGVEWAQYVNLQTKKLMPIFFIGWGADYPDPHNFMQPYMYSKGYFAAKCGYNNPEADKLVMEGAAVTDPAKRKEIYYRLQDIWLEDTIGIMLYQPNGNRYFKDWVKGYEFHPMENNPYKFKMFSKGY
jgi:peptide/nickel transport system substrate-binding protein